MCLDEVTSTTRDRKREGIGWKVFNKNNGMLYGEFYDANGDYDQSKSPFKLGIWLKSRGHRRGYYPIGFHMFKTRAEARSWAGEGCQAVKKVRYKDFLASGMGNNERHIIVAKEIFIL